MKTKKILSLVLLVVLVMSLSMYTVAQASEITAFRDVPEENWAHDAIMDMVERGMFNGTSKPENGVGTFSPGNHMSRAQLVAVLTRYLYPEELATLQKAKPVANVPWFYNNYNIATSHGLLQESELENGELNKPCTRQEMAMLLTRAANLATGETPRQLAPESRIADFASINNYYKEYVLQAYSMGLLTGVDDIGTFLPNATLTRAQAAVVIYRLIEPTTRQVIRYNEIGTFKTSNGVIYEGEHINQEANGYGKMTFPDIGFYEGYFTNGERNGIGTFEWNVGDRYVGSWQDDAMNGGGTYTFSDGYVIRGNWENNRISVESLMMNTSELTLPTHVETYIVALSNPRNITDPIKWTCSNTSVLEITGQNNVCILKGKQPGVVTVTANTESGKKCSCEVTVEKGSSFVQQIVLDSGDHLMSAGEKLQLTATTTKSGEDAKLTWTSSDEYVASVSASGLVYAKNEGTAIITATAESGVAASCYITVYNTNSTLWDGNWKMCKSDEFGSEGILLSSSCQFKSIGDTLEVNIYAYPFNGDEITLEEENFHTYSGTYEATLANYELTFISINEREIILELNEISTLDSSMGSVRTGYYLLNR